MLVTPIKTANEFVEHLNHSLKHLKPGGQLTKIQIVWLSTVIVGIIMTERLCWALFDRRGFNTSGEEALRWVFRRAKISWHLLLRASVQHILQAYGVTSGTLVIDDTDKKRAKVTKKIHGAHKIKDKSSGGYLNGQELVFMILVTDQISFPVDFTFYIPDPSLAQWKKENKELKKQGVPKKDRPCKPNSSDEYPSKQALALLMIERFLTNYKEVSVKVIIADALYGTAHFIQQATTLSGAQVISQIKKNQLVQYKNRWVTAKDLFSLYTPIDDSLVIRGGEEKKVSLYGCRIKLKSHGKKRFIIALKYEGETDYRYLVASDMSWRYADIARAYTLRWLVEVFIQDWKTHGGWNRLAKHQGEEGSTRGVILSLLCDHLLLCHPEQSALLKNNQPGMPAGCVIERLKNEALVTVVSETVSSENPRIALDNMIEALNDALPIRDSSRHMAGRDLGRMVPTPSLRAQNDEELSDMVA